MTKRIVAAVVTALAALALAGGGAQANAMTINGPPVLQQWTDESKAPTPDISIALVEMSEDLSPCDGEDACIEQSSSAPRMFVTPAFWLESAQEQRQTLYHEIGHEFDALYLTDADRAWLAQWAFAFPAELPWLGAADHHTAGEAFAEQYAFCAMFGPKGIGPHGELAPIPMLYRYDWKPIGHRLYRRLCHFIELAG